jgi:adenylate cyclase
MNTDAKEQSGVPGTEAPFPLWRYFYLGVLPGLLLVIVAVIYATTQTVRSATVEVLLQLASHKMEGIAKGVETTVPEAWRKLLSGASLDPGDLAALGKAFGNEQREAQIALLKIYGTDRRTLYATEAAEMGKIEDKPALRDALARGTASVLVEQDAEGGAFYELYLPYRSDGRIAAVFELYEPMAGFDALLWKVSRPVLIVPLVLLAIMAAILAWLVGRAQADIDLRTSLIIALRQRLEKLVSHRAVAAMRTADAGPKRAETLEVTIYYSDVRGFTGFSEQNSPEAVIDFLNRIIGLQIEIVEARGGDVDKMVGDAVLARFHGPERAARAIAAAIDVQWAVKASGLARGLGIGLYDGPVVAGLIGRGDRFDYTVVGDSVNIAARICGLAEAGEIIADSATAAMVPDIAFGPEKVVRVKGRAGKLRIRAVKDGGAPRS